MARQQDVALHRRVSVPALVGRAELCGALNMLDVAANKANGWLTFLLGLCGLCNNANVDPHTGKISGSATEAALLTTASKSLDVAKLRTLLPMTSQIAFDSARKYQLNVHRFSDADSRTLLVDQCRQALEQQSQKAAALAILKGGSEIVIDACAWCLHEGDVDTFTPGLKQKAMEAMDMLADSGERVLGVAFCLAQQSDVDAERDETLLKSNMVFAGLVSLTDPPRAGVSDAIAKCRSAGIKVAMVTGDHPATAAAIARQVNIFTADAPPLRVADFRGLAPKLGLGEAVLVLGKELAGLSAAEWQCVLQCREFVFARTTPENKMDIVRHFQKAGHVVAATGDGVNDAAALKRADVGIAMGVMGTEISKDAANVIE